MVEMSDPEILRNLDQNSRQRRGRDRTSLPMPPEVLALCKDPTEVDRLARVSLVAEEYDSESESEDLYE